MSTVKYAAKYLCLVVIVGIFLSGCTLPFQKSAVSGLQITTEGLAASVYLNGSKVGSTPYSEQTLKPGSYTVRLEPENQELAAYETSITLYSTTLAVMNWSFGNTTESSGGVVYELEPLKKKKESQLSISSIPDGAIVKVDDVSQGFTPVLLKSMTAGTHRFQVSLPSYKTLEDSVKIAEGFQMNVIVKLAKDKVIVPILEDSPSATESSEASVSGKTTATPSVKKTDTKTATTSAAPRSTSTTTTNSSSKSVVIKETGTGWLRVRATPDSGGKELAKVDVGETFIFSQIKSGWYEIEYEKDKMGWVSGQYVTEK